MMEESPRMRTKGEMIATVKECFPGLPDNQCEAMVNRIIEKLNKEFLEEKQI